MRGRPELRQPKPVIKLEPVDEWHMTVSNAMNKHASNQLNTYVQIITNEMNGILREVQHTPLQGIIAMRAENNDLRDTIQNLLYSLPEYILENYKDLEGGYIYPEDKDIAVIFKDFQNIELLRGPKAGKKEPYIPQLSKEGKNITLYVTAASNINFGKTAANIAAVYDCIKTVVDDYGEIVVLDTLDVYSDFTRERMRLPQKILDKIEIIPLNVSDPDIDYLRQIRKPVVITGWADSKAMITRPWEKERTILEYLNTDHIYLIDRAVKDINTSKVYNDRCILPYQEYSKRKNYISKIIYNLPVPPKKIKKPLYDDVRVIIGEKVEIKICPALKGIASKFEKYDRRKKIDCTRNLSLLKREQVYDLIAHMRTDYAFEKLIFDYDSMGKKEEIIRLFHLPFVKEKKKQINREFRSRNPFKRIIKMHQRTYRVPYSDEFGKRTQIVEAMDDVKAFIETQEELNYILKDFNGDFKNNIMQSMILAETRLGLNLLPIIEESKYNFYKAYCMLDMNYEKFEKNTYWYNLLFLALRTRYTLRDNHLMQLWKQFSTWMLYTLGYEMRSNIKYMFNIANIWRQLESRSLYYLSLDREVIRDEEQGVIEIGSQYSIIRFEDSRGMFEFTDVDELKEVHWQISHPDVVLNDFKIMGVIPICSGYLGSERYLWLKNDWSEVRKFRMRVDELKEWNIRNIQLIPCNIEEIPTVDPYIPETKTLDPTFVACKLVYNEGIDMTIYSKKSDEISKQVYKVFGSVEELMMVMRQLWGSISHPLEFEGYYCKIEYRYDVDWGIFVVLSKYLGKIDVPFTLEDFDFVNKMEKIHVSCYLTHNEENCKKDHPECWIWESFNEELDYYLEDYTSPADIKNIYDRKIIELEDLDKIYYLKYKFDEESVVYQENKIIKSILSRHKIKRHLLLDYLSHEKEVTRTLLSISHDVGNNLVVLTFVNNITKEQEVERRSYIADNKIEQMKEVLRTINELAYSEDNTVPEDVVKKLRKECESYLDDNKLPVIDHLDPPDLEIVVSDFDCDKVDEYQYQLQLKIDDEWHNYIEENDSNFLLNQDEVVDLIDNVLDRVDNEESSTIDILSILIGYFKEADLTDFEIIPEGSMDDIKEILTDLKTELLNSMNDK